jgi:hypothetical protein
LLLGYLYRHAPALINHQSQIEDAMRRRRRNRRRRRAQGTIAGEEVE